MPRIHISDLNSSRAASIGNPEAFEQAVSDSVLRAIEVRQQQDIRGGRIKEIICGGFPIPPDWSDPFPPDWSVPGLPGRDIIL